nr:MAG TPA: hypothetical protein [Caudoviricetes sp.]
MFVVLILTYKYNIAHFSFVVNNFLELFLCFSKLFLFFSCK